MVFSTCIWVQLATHPYQMQDTLVPWLMAYRVSTHVAIYTNSRHGNYTTWGTCSVPQRTEWGAEGLPFLLPWIATMGYHHLRWISWGAASRRSDLRGCRAWIHANHTASPASSTPASHHNTLGEKLPYEAPGDLPPFQTKDLLSLEEMGSPLHVPTATYPPGIPRQCHPEGLFCHCTSLPFTIPGHHVQIPRSS